MQMPQDYTVTGDFVYLRFHGLKDGAYHDYTPEELEPWAKQLHLAASRGLPCYVYFNNDLNTRAPLNAEALMKCVGRHVMPAFAPEPAPTLAIKAPKRGPETWPSWQRTGRTRRAPPASTRGKTASRRPLKATSRD